MAPPLNLRRHAGDRERFYSAHESLELAAQAITSSKLGNDDYLIDAVMAEDAMHHPIDPHCTFPTQKEDLTYDMESVMQAPLSVNNPNQITAHITLEFPGGRMQNMSIPLDLPNYSSQEPTPTPSLYELEIPVALNSQMEVQEMSRDTPVRVTMCEQNRTDEENQQDCSGSSGEGLFGWMFGCCSTTTTTTTTTGSYSTTILNSGSLGSQQGGVDSPWGVGGSSNFCAASSDGSASLSFWAKEPSVHSHNQVPVVDQQPQMIATPQQTPPFVPRLVLPPPGRTGARPDIDSKDRRPSPTNIMVSAQSSISFAEPGDDHTSVEIPESFEVRPMAPEPPLRPTTVPNPAPTTTAHNEEDDLVGDLVGESVQNRILRKSSSMSKATGDMLLSGVGYVGRKVSDGLKHIVRRVSSVYELAVPEDSSPLSPAICEWPTKDEVGDVKEFWELERMTGTWERIPELSDDPEICLDVMEMGWFIRRAVKFATQTEIKLLRDRLYVSPKLFGLSSPQESFFGREGRFCARRDKRKGLSRIALVPTTKGLRQYNQWGEPYQGISIVELILSDDGEFLTTFTFIKRKTGQQGTVKTVMRRVK